jgi:hypothetical protein
MKKLILLVIVFSLSLTLSACGVDSNQGDVSIDSNNPANSDLTPVLDSDDNNSKSNDVISETEEEFVASSSIDWQTMERLREGFSVKFPKGWYYVSNYKRAVEEGFSALIGFGDSSAVWKQVPPYAIEIISHKNDIELDFIGYAKEVGEKGNQKFVIRASEKYKDYVDLMAESFKFIDKK